METMPLIPAFYFNFLVKLLLIIMFFLQCLICFVFLFSTRDWFIHSFTSFHTDTGLFSSHPALRDCMFYAKQHFFLWGLWSQMLSKCGYSFDEYFTKGDYQDVFFFAIYLFTLFHLLWQEIDLGDFSLKFTIFF